MNDTDTTKKVDEISQYYAPIKKIGSIINRLFWINRALFFVIPYSTLIFGKSGSGVLQAIFPVLVLIQFALSQASSLYLLPRAEQKRRKQLLSDSFGVALSPDKTSLYYNNEYPPSVQRLGANTMENAFFSHKIAARMLNRKRIIILVYLVAWILVFSIPHDNLELLTWITLLVFSQNIIGEWLRLEILRSRSEHIFNELHSHFLRKSDQDTSDAIATVLDAFVEYEAAKSSAGILLSKTDFDKLNPTLKKEWEQICQKLNMKDNTN